MAATISFVNLKCLNCGANLKISSQIFELACGYCGVNQIVQREGGIVALEFISNKIDQVQTSVDKTTAELKIQRYKSELKELEEQYTNLEKVTFNIKKMHTEGFIILVGLILIPFFVFFLFTNSPIILLLSIFLEFIVVYFWWDKRKKIDLRFNQNTTPLIKRGNELKQKISELEKIVEY